MKLFLTAAVTLSLAAAPVTRAHAADSAEAMMEKVTRVMEVLGGVVDDNKASCDVMADKLRKFFDDNAAVIKEGRAASAKATPEQNKTWEAKYKPRVVAAGKKMQDGLMKCRANAKVKAAMEKMK